MYNTYDEQRKALNDAKARREVFVDNGIRITDKFNNPLYPDDRVGIEIGPRMDINAPGGIRQGKHVEEIGHISHYVITDMNGGRSAVEIRCTEGFQAGHLDEVIKMDL